MKEAEEGTKIIKWTEDSENSTRTGRNKRARQSQRETRTGRRVAFPWLLPTSSEW